MSNRKPTGLHLKDGLFYARRVIPKDVRHLFDRGEFMECLGPDYRIACGRLDGELYRFRTRINEARARLKIEAETQVLARPNLAHRTLTLRELGRTLYRDILDADAVMRRSSHPMAEADVDEGYVADLRATAAGVASDEVIVAAVGDELVGRHQQGLPQWRTEAQQIAGVVLEGLAHTFDRLDGKAIAPKHPLLQSEPHSQLADDENPDSLLPLSALAELTAQARKPAPGTAQEYRVGARMFEEFLGEPKAVRDITRKDVRGFVKLLQETPSNYIKKFPGLTITEAAKANKLRAAPEPLMSAITVAKWHGNVRAVLGYAQNVEIIEKSPAEKIIIEKPRNRTGEPPRIPLAPEDLSRVFAPPYFNGPDSYDEREWALLIALFTGFRASEIAQLPLSGVRLEDGVLCFSVRGEVKNPQSRRTTPIHSALIAMGLEARVKKLRASGEEHLFPVWLKQGIERRINNPKDNQPFSQFIPRSFNRTVLRKQLKILDNKKVFHSLRHNLKTALARAGISREISDAITGHDDDTSGAIYIHEQATKVMKDALEKIHFDGLDLSSLISEPH